jgi:hypothetical protein
VLKVQGQELATKLGCQYFDASCKVPYNIDEPVRYLIHLFLGKDLKKTKSQEVVKIKGKLNSNLQVIV